MSSVRDAGRICLVALVLTAPLLTGCHSVAPATGRPGAGDEIIVADRRIHTGTRVVTWRDPGGYNAYAGLPPLKRRQSSLAPADKKRVEARGWDLPALQKTVDQFVLHYDACGLSKVCFDVLHARGLSVHFLLDVDGTVYQTLDLQERALHATTSNDRSIGIEIANIGAYPPGAAQPLAEWYRHERRSTILTVPARIQDPRILTPNFTGRPARPSPVRARVQGKTLVQYDLTLQQYAALIKLTAALCRVFPLIRSDYPHAADGRVIPHALPARELAGYRGVLGHYHIQEDKTDPGPAFQWEGFIQGVRRALR